MTRKAPKKALTGRRSGREFEALLKKVRACRVCEAHLPFGPRPVLRAAITAQLLIVGQAPGRRVLGTGVPWNDPSGERLRDWLIPAADHPAGSQRWMKPLIGLEV